MRKRRSDYSTLEIAQGKMPRLGKQVEDAGDRFMATMGFDAIRLSQARATTQTPGISDRRYYNTSRGVAAWWEAKREDGKQTEAEYKFQQIVEACGEVYLLGTEEVLVAWCKDMCPSFEPLGLDGGGGWSVERRGRYQPERFRWRPPKKSVLTRLAEARDSGPGTR